MGFPKGKNIFCKKCLVWEYGRRWICRDKKPCHKDYEIKLVGIYCVACFKDDHKFMVVGCGLSDFNVNPNQKVDLELD